MTNTASNYSRAENDLYQTEPWATEALLRNIPSVSDFEIWEPAAGNHLTADVLRKAGAHVITSDFEKYDRGHSFPDYDFLTPPPPELYGAGKFDAIITNLPFGYGNRRAVKFIETALERCDGIVAMLLTAKFDFGKTRRHLFADNPRFWMKIALMDRLSWTLHGNTVTEDYAWYVWGEGNNNSPICRWADKPPLAEQLAELGIR